MKISFNPNQQRQQMLNVERINQSVHFNDKNYKSPQGAEKQERRDRAVLSPVGKATSVLETLMKQKQQILENKNTMITEALAKGETMESLKVKIENYDEQLKNIDEQLSKTMAEEIKDSAEKNEESKKSGYKTEEPKTAEEVEKAKLTSVINLENSIEELENLRSVKNKVEGEKRVLLSEVKITTGTPLPSTLKRISDLEVKSSELMGKFGKIVEKVNKEANETGEIITSAEEKNEGEISNNVKNIEPDQEENMVDVEELNEGV